MEMNSIDYTGDPRAVLCHFNPYHDPKNGQFTESSRSGVKHLAIAPSKSSGDSSNSDNASVGSKNNYDTSQAEYRHIDREKLKKILKIGGIAVGSALVVLGARYLIDDAVANYAKRHKDYSLRAGQILSTLSFDPDRTKGADMAYTTINRRDRTFYTGFFNTPVSELLDKNGDVIGTGRFFKKRIDNKVASRIRVASEDSGAKIFTDLFRRDKAFSDFVMNPDGMLKRFDNAPNNPRRFKAYRDAISVLERVRKSEQVSDRDLSTIYKLFNFVIPNTDDTTITQRKKFFSALSSAGYGALLDTNDAMYGGFHARKPTIVFDMAKIVPDRIYQTSARDAVSSRSKALVAKIFGITL